MSRRQEERAERRYAFWIPRFFAATGRVRAEVAWEYVIARINDLPARDRAGVFEALADDLIGSADRLTRRDIHIGTSHRSVNVPEALRAQARRAGARETA